MNLKTLAIAALLATSAASSFATSYNKGDVTSSNGFDAASSTLSGSFSDVYTFQLSGTNDVSEIWSNTWTAKSGKISDFTVALSGPGLSDTETVTTTFGGTKSGGQTIYADYSSLAAGTYTLTVSGIAAANSTYTGSLSVSAVSAVPEPANVALLMAGMGVLAFVAKRRKNG